MIKFWPCVREGIRQSAPKKRLFYKFSVFQRETLSSGRRTAPLVPHSRRRRCSAKSTLALVRMSSSDELLDETPRDDGAAVFDVDRDDDSSLFSRSPLPGEQPRSAVQVAHAGCCLKPASSLSSSRGLGALFWAARIVGKFSVCPVPWLARRERALAAWACLSLFSLFVLSWVVMDRMVNVCPVPWREQGARAGSPAWASRACLSLPRSLFAACCACFTCCACKLCLLCWLAGYLVTADLVFVDMSCPVADRSSPQLLLATLKDLQRDAMLTLERAENQALLAFSHTPGDIQMIRDSFTRIRSICLKTQVNLGRMPTVLVGFGKVRCSSRTVAPRNAEYEVEWPRGRKTSGSLILSVTRSIEITAEVEPENPAELAGLASTTKLDLELELTWEDGVSVLAPMRCALRRDHGGFEGRASIMLNEDRIHKDGIRMVAVLSIRNFAQICSRSATMQSPSKTIVFVPRATFQGHTTLWSGDDVYEKIRLCSPAQGLQLPEDLMLQDDQDLLALMPNAAAAAAAAPAVLQPDDRDRGEGNSSTSRSRSGAGARARARARARAGTRTGAAFHEDRRREAEEDF
jgi:hypothetical protein